nr:MAG TPA: hypothetical protein [Caudoviricetes sp.]
MNNILSFNADIGFENVKTLVFNIFIKKPSDFEYNYCCHFAIRKISNLLNHNQITAEELTDDYFASIIIEQISQYRLMNKCLYSSNRIQEAG